MKRFDSQLLRLKGSLGITSDQEVAALLGMTKAAFSDRKRRDSFPEDKLYALAARSPELLLDVNYVLTGRDVHSEAAEKTAAMSSAVQRRFGSLNVSEPESRYLPELSGDEQELLALFRAAPLTLKMRVVTLLSGDMPEDEKRKNKAVKVKGNNNRTAGGTYNEK